MRAVVCGAGIAGLAAAWWLEQDGWDVLLVERANAPREAGYSIDLFGSGFDVAEQMGLLPRLRASHTEIAALRYVDPAGRPMGAVDYATLAGTLDGRLVSLQRSELEHELWSSLGSRVPVRFATTVEGLVEEADGVDVRLSDGTTRRVELLVGADGLHSTVRAMLFGPEQLFLRYLGYQTASFRLDDAELLASVGRDCLLVAAPGRQAGFYPTGDGDLAMWLAHHAPDPRLPVDRVAALREHYEALGPLVRQGLEHLDAGTDLYYDQVTQVQADAWSRGHVVLVGDSCQAPSLMAGQGAALALGGAWVLAEELRAGGSVPEACARYELRMRPFVTDRQAAGRAAARWMVPTERWRLHVRGAALRTSRLPGATRLLAPLLRRSATSIVRDHPAAR